MSNFKIDHDRDSIRATYSCPTASGTPFEVAVTVPLAPAREAAKAYLKQMYGDTAGWDWGKLSGAIKSLGKKLAVDKAVGMIKKITNDPLFAKGMALASTVVPALGVSYGAVRAASQVVDGMMAGSEEAQTKIKAVADAAAAGNAAAAKAQLVLRYVYRAKRKAALAEARRTGRPRLREHARAQVSGDPALVLKNEVAGWLYNLGYRDNLSARELALTGPWHQRDPRHVHRYLYAKGLQD